MLNTREGPIPLEEKMAAFQEACRSAGLRLTHQRLELFRELAKATDHPTAETLHRRLRRRLPTLSLDTVYRTLGTFERFGLISRVQTAESQARFEAEKRRHHHLICERCGRIEDFQWPGFDASPLPEPVAAWGQVKSRTVVLQGVCEACRRRGSPASPPDPRKKDIVSTELPRSS